MSVGANSSFSTQCAWRLLLSNRLLLAASLSGTVAICMGCGDPDEEEPSSDGVAFPADYATSYTEVRDCRPSGDHDLNNIRVVVDSAALGPFQDRSTPFPTGSIVLKEEFEFDDIDCTGEVKQWTVMQKLEAGSAADTLDWAWQQVDRDRRVVSENSQRCVACHSACVDGAVGYDATCADP